MVKVLYIDKELYEETSRLREKSLNLIDKLKERNFEIDIVDEFELCEWNNFQLSDIGVIKDFRKRLGWILDDLKKYNSLVVHLGTGAPRNFSNYVLPNISNLKISQEIRTF